MNSTGYFLPTYYRIYRATADKTKTAMTTADYLISPLIHRIISHIRHIVNTKFACVLVFMNHTKFACVLVFGVILSFQISYGELVPSG